MCQSAESDKKSFAFYLHAASVDMFVFKHGAPFLILLRFRTPKTQRRVILVILKPCSLAALARTSTTKSCPLTDRSENTQHSIRPKLQCKTIHFFGLSARVLSLTFEMEPAIASHKHIQFPGHFMSSLLNPHHLPQFESKQDFSKSLDRWWKVKNLPPIYLFHLAHQTTVYPFIQAGSHSPSSRHRACKQKDQGNDL